MKQYYNHSIEDVSKEFQTDAVKGLSPDGIADRLEKYGKNVLVQKKGRPFIVMFLEQFKSFLIILLIIAAVISGVMGVRTGEGLLDTYIIMGILLLNAFIGAYQEFQAQKSMDALKKMGSTDGEGHTWRRIIYSQSGGRGTRGCGCAGSGGYSSG